MKIVLKISLLLFLFQSNGQEVGIINDIDGFTNLRSGPGSDYSVIETIKESKSFLFYRNEESAWWKVEIPPYYGSPRAGYIHKSRIQSYYPDGEGCICKMWDKEIDKRSLLNFQLGSESFSICGYLLQRHSEQSIKISEFSITNCTTSEMVQFYGAVDTYKVSFVENRLELLQLKYLPVGKGFKWIQTPFEQHFLQSEVLGLELTKPKSQLNLGAITANDVEIFENALENYRGKGYFDQVEDFLGKLFIASLKGSDRSKSIFLDVENFLSLTFGGHLKEEYEEYVQLLKQLN